MPRLISAPRYLPGGFPFQLRHELTTRTFGIFSIVLAMILSPTAHAADPQRPPNIVFLLADDLGYGDLHCMGHPYSQTPAIDRLAKDGTLFKHFYAAGATCGPSRAGLMTSQFPARFAKAPASFAFSGAITVTDLLKKNGYRTGHFGKWHMGPEEKDGTFGIESIKVLGGNPRDETGRDSETAAAAVEFIKANKSAPFYVNICFQSPRNPVQPPRSFADRFANVKVNRADFPNPDMQAHFDLYEKLGGKLDEGMQNYLGEVLQLDGQVAKVLQTIDDLGLRDNTIVVFTSDNGPARCTGIGENAAKAEPIKPDLKKKPDPKKKELPRETLVENMLGSTGPLLRDRKPSLYDGGVRQPLIVRWPGHVKAGRVDEGNVLAGVDWLPTVAGVAGILIDAARYDGEDVSDIWLGAARERKRNLYWKASNPRDTPVVRHGNWKLHLPSVAKKDSVELYDLAKDPGERENLAAKHPEIVTELTNILRRWNSSLPSKYEKGEVDDD